MASVSPTLWAGEVSYTEPMIRPTSSIVLISLAACLFAQAQVQRPPITGLAQASLRTNDLALARQFYGKELGLPETPGPHHAAVFEVNPRQFIDITPDLKDDAQDRLASLAFETTNAKQLRDYLASRGVAVPGRVASDRNGNLSFFVKDPEGHAIGFIQYERRPASPTPSQPADRLSQHLIHAGFVAHNRAALDAFYQDILGFQEMWHGGKTDTSVDWVDMRVPDGDDWLEYMLNVSNTSAKTRGVMNHLAFGVPSVAQAATSLKARGFNPTEQPKVGRDGKWQLNLYDPNLTRAELMEPKPVQTPCCSEMKSR